jgi:hypothetical protein
MVAKIALVRSHSIWLLRLKWWDSVIDLNEDKWEHGHGCCCDHERGDAEPIANFAVRNELTIYRQAVRRAFGEFMNGEHWDLLQPRGTAAPVGWTGYKD